MSVVDTCMGDAKAKASYLIAREFRGPGDTIERAAYQAETKWGVPASILLRLRRRPVTDMLLSNWLRLSAAYESAVAAAVKQAQHQEALARAVGVNEANSALYRGGVLLAGAKDEAAE